MSVDINGILHKFHYEFTHGLAEEDSSLLLGQIPVLAFRHDISLPIDDSVVLSYFCGHMRYRLGGDISRFMLHFWLAHGYMDNINAFPFLEKLGHRSTAGIFDVFLDELLHTVEWTPENCTRLFDKLIENMSYFNHSMIYKLFSDKIVLGPGIMAKLMYSGVNYRFVKRMMRMGADPFCVFGRTNAIGYALEDRLYDYKQLIALYMTDDSYPHHEKVRIFMKYIEDKTGKTYRDLPLSRNLVERHRDGAFQAALAYDSLSEFSQCSAGDTWFSLTPATEFIPVEVFDAGLLTDIAIALNGSGGSYVDWMPADILTHQFGGLFKSIYCTAAHSSRLHADERARTRRRLF